MNKSLPLSQVEEILNNVVDAFPHDECSTCECFLGYIAQLQIDSEKSSRQLLKRYKPDRQDIHSCLGCDPCPPGNHYATYMSEKPKRNGIITTISSTPSCLD